MPCSRGSTLFQSGVRRVSLSTMSVSPASDLLQEGLALHRRGAVDEAAARYAEVLRADPANADALYYLALISCQHGRFEEGAELARKSLASDPKQARSHVILGRALHALGLHDDALASFDRAIALAPELAPAHANRADVLSKIGRNAEALDSYDRALALGAGFGRRLDEPRRGAHRAQPARRSGYQFRSRFCAQPRFRPGRRFSRAAAIIKAPHLRLDEFGGGNRAGSGHGESGKAVEPALHHRRHPIVARRAIAMRQTLRAGAAGPSAALAGRALCPRSPSRRLPLGRLQRAPDGLSDGRPVRRARQIAFRDHRIVVRTERQFAGAAAAGGGVRAFHRCRRQQRPGDRRAHAPFRNRHRRRSHGFYQG